MPGGASGPNRRWRGVEGSEKWVERVVGELQGQRRYLSQRRRLVPGGAGGGVDGAVETKALLRADS